MNAPPSAELALCLALLAASPPTLSAQARAGGRAGDAVVRGSVVTPDDKPIALAIVELRVPRDSAPIRSTRSSDAGRFQLDSIAPGTYYLLIRRIGFAAATTTGFTVVAGQVRDLGRIQLQQSVVELTPIVVTVERPDVTFEPDRTGYLVEALAPAAGGTVNDALRQIPDVLVDIVPHP